MLPQSCDCLVVGSGVAGLSAAITAADKGLKVELLFKSADPRESNTWFAQGGIVGEGVKDSPEALMKDILKAGDHMNWVDAVELISQQGPSLMESLLIDRAGVNFTKRKDGSPDLTREGAHTTRRVFHKMDLSGQAILKGLVGLAAHHKNITFHPHMMAVDIITNCHHSTISQERYRPPRAIGLYIYDQKKDEILPVYSGSVILATGGVGDVYQHSSNPSSATGDGIAMAYRAGASIINSEYVQFHPTTLYHRDERNFLITEALRGEGAHLVNRRGERFMERFNPEMMELASRDEVSRAIYQEMDATGAPCVFLKTDSIELDLKTRFPGIYKTCLALGIDIQKDQIPVVPAAHYFCGGLKVDLQGATSIDGLYAVGETACTGVHGANRLASVSLLEGLYFGARTGEYLCECNRSPSEELIRSIPPWHYPKDQIDVDPLLIHSDRNTIRSLMWNYTGIIRTRKRLKRALADLNYFSHRVESFYREARISKSLLEMRNSLLTSYLITRAASSNSKSRGCHWVEG